MDLAEMMSQDGRYGAHANRQPSALTEYGLARGNRIDQLRFRELGFALTAAQEQLVARRPSERSTRRVHPASAQKGDRDVAKDACDVVPPPGERQLQSLIQVAGPEPNPDLPLGPDSKAPRMGT